MAFKVKTTAPKKYCVKPNTGCVAPGATQTVHVIMQAQREWPADMNACKDKFLVQSTVSGGETDFAKLFHKENEDIKEDKLRVSYVHPAPPPSPVPEGEEEKGDEAAERPTLSRMYTSKPDFDSAKAEAKAARSAAPEDTAALQREVERYRLKNESLTADLNMALRNDKEGVAGASRGFSLLHLLITGASWPAPVNCAGGHVSPHLPCPTFQPPARLPPDVDIKKISIEFFFFLFLSLSLSPLPLLTLWCFFARSFFESRTHFSIPHNVSSLLSCLYPQPFWRSSPVSRSPSMSSKKNKNKKQVK